MRDRLLNTTVMLSAVALVGASLYVILGQGVSLFEQTRKEAPARTMMQPVYETVETPLPPVTVERTPVHPNLQREAAQRVTSGVYRCEEDGRIVYADQPCMNGRPVKQRP